MKRVIVVVGVVAVCLAGLVALDWYALGGPITSTAIKRCESASWKEYRPDGSERPGYWSAYDSGKRIEDWEWKALRKDKGHSRARAACKEAWRSGRLSVRGGMTR